MDGQIDIKLIITLGGILFSVAGAAAIGKMQIKVILEQLADIETRLRSLDTRADKIDTLVETHQQRISVLASMSSPENLRRDHMKLASTEALVEQLRVDTDRILRMHNGVHPPVSDERKAT